MKCLSVYTLFMLCVEIRLHLFQFSFEISIFLFEILIEILNRLFDVAGFLGTAGEWLTPRRILIKTRNIPLCY